MANMGVRT